NPSLTVVKQPAFEMGQTATELLINLIESKRAITEFETVMLQTELIVRDSTEKKDAVDNLFETDITAKEYEEFKNEFLIISEIIFKFDTIYPIKKTRYKQRNDFYTLFGFVSQNKKIKFELLSYFYKILVLIGDDISPSNDECEPFKEYALNCVSQSNSKKARELRLVFLKELFLNESEEGNETQKKILDFYDLKISDMKKLNGFFTLDFDKLQSAVEYPQLTIL
ncbi:MAG: substrate-binding domain-containing protein, partial [Ignavibacteria bacterium]